MSHRVKLKGVRKNRGKHKKKEAGANRHHNCLSWVGYRLLAGGSRHLHWESYVSRDQRNPEEARFSESNSLKTTCEGGFEDTNSWWWG